MEQYNQAVDALTDPELRRKFEKEQDQIEHDEKRRLELAKQRRIFREQLLANRR